MGASKLVILKGGQGLRYGRSLPTPFHGYSEEGTGENKQRRKRNETDLHGRVELAGNGDIHFNTKYHESRRSSRLFCHKHSATRYK